MKGQVVHIKNGSEGFDCRPTYVAMSESEEDETKGFETK